MDKNELITKLEQALPGAVIEKPKFGRTAQACLWIEMANIIKVARFLRDEPGIELDWLENLSVMQVDDALVLTYFLRSSKLGSTAILRGSVVPDSAEAEANAPSVAEVWPTARLIEHEIDELFGITFGKGRAANPSANSLDWQGYPLRKSYAINRAH